MILNQYPTPVSLSGPRRMTDSIKTISISAGDGTAHILNQGVSPNEIELEVGETYEIDIQAADPNAGNVIRLYVYQARTKAEAATVSAGTPVGRRWLSDFGPLPIVPDAEGQWVGIALDTVNTDFSVDVTIHKVS